MTTARDGLTLPVDAVTETFGIVGVRGSGKTTTAKVLTEELTKASQQVVVIDPLGVWWGLKSSADGKYAGLPFVILGGDHGDIPITKDSGELIADLVIREPVPAVIDLSHMRKGEQRHWMMEFSEKLYHLNREALHLVVDEVDLFAPQRPIKGAERLLGAMEDLVRRGRARGLGVTTITQRPASVHKDILSQVSTLVVHRLVGPQDRRAIDLWVEANGTKEQRDELMNTVASLPTGTAWFWSPSWLNIFEKVAVRLPDTFDSSATPKAGEKRIEPKAFAQIDLGALKDQMAEVVEEAEKSDPKVLLRQLNEARRELDNKERQLETARKRTVPAGKAPSPETVEKIVDRLVTQSVGVVPEALRDAALSTADGLDEAAGAMREAAELQSQGLKAAAAGFVAQAKMLRQAVAAADRSAGKPVGDPEASESPRPVPRVVPVARAADVPRSTTVSRPPSPRVVSGNGDSDEDGALGAGAQRMLAAMARSYPRRLTLVQLLHMAGMRRSGTSQGYVKTLLNRGLLAQGADKTYEITEAGFAAAGADVPDAPMTTDELLGMWRGTLSGGAQRMFDVLVAAYPQDMTRAELIEAVGMSVSGTSQGYVKTLEKSNLLTVEGSRVRASDDLFSADAVGV